MNRREVMGSFVFGLVLIAAMLQGGVARAQSADIDGVKAASKAFYDALSVLDDGAAMAKVWAQKPYVTYVSPTSKAATVGWEAQAKSWPENNARTTKRSVKIVDANIHINGNLAWEIGTETGEVVMKDGAVRQIEAIATNIYEKSDGRWLMVSHHAATKPK